jgi:recombination protein RecA
MGKSLIAQVLAKDIQDKNNGYVCWLDFEYSFDYSFAQKIGLNVSSDKFKLINPNTIEEGFDIIEQLARTGEVALVCWDSVNAAQTNSESEADYGSANMGINARMFSQGLKKVLAYLSKNNTTLLLISQMREKFTTMGDPRVIGVGKAIAFYSSIRLEVKRMEYLLDTKKEIVGSKIRLKTIKNKTYCPNKEAEIDFYLYTDNPGIDKFIELTDYAIKYSLITGKGWYTLPDQSKVQGKEAVAEYYRNHLDKYETDKQQVLKLMFNQTITNDNIQQVLENSVDNNDEIAND